MGNIDAILRATLGREPGMNVVRQFGYNPAVGNGAVETIWDQGGLYVYDSAATTMYVSSSSTDDDGTSSPIGSGATSVIVEGLNANWETVTEIVTLNGQTGVQIPTDLIRVRVMSALAGTNAGDLYVGTEAAPTVGVPAAGNVRAKALIGHGESMTGIYSVPANRTAIMLLFTAFGGKGDSITGDFYIRPFGLTFAIKGKIQIFESATPIPFRGGVAIPPKSDVEFRAISGTQNTIVSAFAEFVLIDNRSS